MSYILFYSYHFVEAFLFREFIQKNDLSAILNHAMTCKACKGENSLAWMTFKEAI